MDSSNVMTFITSVSKTMSGRTIPYTRFIGPKYYLAVKSARWETRVTASLVSAIIPEKRHRSEIHVSCYNDMKFVVMPKIADVRAIHKQFGCFVCEMVLPGRTNGNVVHSVVLLITKTRGCIIDSNSTTCTEGIDICKYLCSKLGVEYFVHSVSGFNTMGCCSLYSAAFMHKYGKSKKSYEKVVELYDSLRKSPIRGTHSLCIDIYYKDRFKLIGLDRMVIDCCAAQYDYVYFKN